MQGLPCASSTWLSPRVSYSISPFSRLQQPRSGSTRPLTHVRPIDTRRTPVFCYDYRCRACVHTSPVLFRHRVSGVRSRVHAGSSLPKLDDRSELALGFATIGTCPSGRRNGAVISVVERRSLGIEYDSCSKSPGGPIFGGITYRLAGRC